jgi:hypothetical protein
MAGSNRSQGLTCPNCAGVVPVPEGVRIVTCPFCDNRSLVKGERGVRRWQVSAQIDRSQALEAAKGFFGGLNKARDLKRRAIVEDIFLIYLPYWRVQAFVAGWIFGRVSAGDNRSKPTEIEVMEEMEWHDAAADVAEFGVERVTVSKQELVPYNAEQLHAEALVFEPVESQREAAEEAEMNFRHRSRRRLKRQFFERIHILRRRLSLVYFPLWVARYEYHKRQYQVVIDGRRGKVLYGKAPGNILYRAAMLVLGMAVGNFVLINGTVIAGLVISGGDDDSIALLLIPILLGIGLMIAGYRRFRHGEEVEYRQKEARKAPLGRSAQGQDLLSGGLELLDELSDLDLRRF